MKKVNHCLIALPLLKQLNGLLSNCFAVREHDTRAVSKDNQSGKDKNFPFSYKDKIHLKAISITRNIAYMAFKAK